MLTDTQLLIGLSVLLWLGLACLAGVSFQAAGWVRRKVRERGVLGKWL